MFCVQVCGQVGENYIRYRVEVLLYLDEIFNTYLLGHLVYNGSYSQLISLFSFFLDDLSTCESQVLKSPTIKGWWLKHGLNCSSVSFTKLCALVIVADILKIKMPLGRFFFLWIYSIFPYLFWLVLISSLSCQTSKWLHHFVSQINLLKIFFCQPFTLR